MPATQQRIGTTTGMRQIKDARYWQSQLQVKMDEIRRETERLIKEKSNLDREKSAKKTFERRAKESTKELTGNSENIESFYKIHFVLIKKDPLFFCCSISVASKALRHEYCIGFSE